jgi:phosphatidylethanolamine-binding protein (PEBP) family uncharacterized protein
MYLANQTDCFVILVEDPDLPKVYSHVAVCYTKREAHLVATALKSTTYADQNVYIEHSMLVKA